jgi:hypothetical protein
MNDYCYKRLGALFYRFWHCRLVEKENIPLHGPAVFVANHLSSYAPIAVLSVFPVRLYPWVAHQHLDRKLCPDYMRKKFVEPELRLKPPLSSLLAWAISNASVAFMKSLNAIPVYEKSMKLASTWKQSLALLTQGKFLIVFPENEYRTLNRVLNEFKDGFLGLGPAYHEKTGGILKFVPVAVHKRAGTIRIAQPISFNPGCPFALEKERIKTALQDRITEMLESPRIHSGNIT